MVTLRHAQWAVFGARLGCGGLRRRAPLHRLSSGLLATSEWCDERGITWAFSPAEIDCEVLSPTKQALSFCRHLQAKLYQLFSIHSPAEEVESIPSCKTLHLQQRRRIKASPLGPCLLCSYTELLSSWQDQWPSYFLVQLSPHNVSRFDWVDPEGVCSVMSAYSPWKGRLKSIPPNSELSKCQSNYACH